MNVPLGATFQAEEGCHFLVWAPCVRKCEVHVVEPLERNIEMLPLGRGYYYALAEGVAVGAHYYYRLDAQTEKPDPASRFQPQGVHGPSEVIDLAYDWKDVGWKGLELDDYIIYELHVGTFTARGTFEGVIEHLERLKELGISAIELMPIAQFPGRRNWGYDGVYPFSVQNSYGSPAALKALVEECHARGLAVVLDVVYNHLGPEGNYLASFGPYLTDRYRTPWGPAINFDGPECDEVRRFFIENALYWVRQYHFDALRLDAVHAIIDASANPFLEELGNAVHTEAERVGRMVYVIAESDRNDSRIVRPVEAGGTGLDAQWNDDFHHAVHALITGERNGYYSDFGSVGQLAKAWREGFVYSGEYSAYRQRRHGNRSSDLAPERFVVFAQNHDQVGNRMKGERLSQLVSFEALKLAAGLVLLSPFIPLLFMGEEFGEVAPFEYFSSHSDPGLIEAVRRGRREEFAAFNWQGQAADPQDEGTFDRCKVNHNLRREGQFHTLYEFVRQLIRLRKQLAPGSQTDKKGMVVDANEQKKLLQVSCLSNRRASLMVFNLGGGTAVTEPFSPRMNYNKVIDSADRRWRGKGSLSAEMLGIGEASVISVAPYSFVLFQSN